MAVPSVKPVTPYDPWKKIDNILSAVKYRGFINGKKRVLGVSERLPKNNPTVHAFELDDVEYVIVKLPKLL